jgi:hypothetical protein
MVKSTPIPFSATVQISSKLRKHPTLLNNFTRDIRDIQRKLEFFPPSIEKIEPVVLRFMERTV